MSSCQVCKISPLFAAEPRVLLGGHVPAARGRLVQQAAAGPRLLPRLALGAVARC